MFDPDQKQAIFEQLCAMPTVDGHEHLHSEAMRTERRVDIFLLFHQYLCTDLLAAGMDAKAAEDLGEEDVPEDQKWDSIAPYLDAVRMGSVAGPPFAALRRFFDEEDLTKDNYARLSEKMREHNRPGVYEKCLKEACNIELVLNQNRTMWQTDLFRPILFEDSFISSGSGESLREVASSAGEDLPDELAGFVLLMEGLLRQRKQEGMIGVKGFCREYAPGDASSAGRAYERVLTGKAAPGDGDALVRYLRSRMYDICGEINLVAVLHSGIWAGSWGDIRTIQPTFIQAMASAHRNTRFDLFHAASPQPAEGGFLGRSLPNVSLNSCWSHLLSPTLTKQAWHMWLEMLPVNRVIAWGGDYWWAVENVYGVLLKVRDILAEVLSERIAAGDFDEARALQIARLWMRDNARSIYLFE